MSNFSGRLVSTRSFMSRKAFSVGFMEAKKGIPFNSDPWERVGKKGSNQVSEYEAGRQFACLYDGPIKIDRRLRPSALWEFNDACNKRDILS